MRPLFYNPKCGYWPLFLTALIGVSSLLLFLMAPSTNDDAAAHTKAICIATKATSSTRQVAEAELARLTVEATPLTANTARPRQEADHGWSALTGATQDPQSSQADDTLALSTDAQAQAHAVDVVLHAQAISVLDIKALIPVVLDNLSPNYNRWKTLFLNTLGKYKLTDHVINNVSTAIAANLHWRSMDCPVRSWLYGTVMSNLIEIATTPSSIARSLWRGLEDQIVGNKETCAMFLDAEFRMFIQGELSNSDYCCRLKAMADALSDLGEAILDHTLILVVLHGLNGRFAHMSSLLKR
jgi:hypothetical protein